MRARAMAVTFFIAALTTAARADVLDTPLPAPAWTKTVGTMRVEKFGTGTPALVLVPGLGSGLWTWHDTIAREVKAHTIYAVTFAGFDGVPFVAAANLDAADASLAQLLSSEKIDRPVLVGHSMGGYLVLRFGTEHANELRGVVSVDGLPVLPQLAQMTPDQRAAAGAKFTSDASTQTPAEFARIEGMYMRDYVTDPTLADKVTALTQRSEQRAIARYGGELYASDLRPELAKLTVPTVVIAPIPAKPLPSYLPPMMAQMTPDQLRQSTVAFYTDLLKGAPQLTVVPVVDSRHYVMLDQPDAFIAALDAFVATLK